MTPCTTKLTTVSPTGMKSSTDGTVVLIGGANSSAIAPRYDQIPSVALRELAKRFSGGSEKYYVPGSELLGGAQNWQNGNGEYFRERLNHAIDHLLMFKSRFEYYKNEGPDLNTEDGAMDDLAAAMWGCAALMWALDNGILKARR